MAEHTAYSTERLDHHGIVAGICHEIELVECVDIVVATFRICLDENDVYSDFAFFAARNMSLLEETYGCSTGLRVVHFHRSQGLS